MPRRYLDHDLPLPLAPVSNGEFAPAPPTRKQRAAAALLRAEADRRARRLGMSRREFLRTAAGTATAFMVLNTIHGLPSRGSAAALPVTPEQCDDPEAARALLGADFFVMDVQIHHVDLEAFGDVPQLGCLRFLEETCTDAGLQLLSQANLVKEVFVDSETAVGVISGVPDGFPLPVDTMARTRDLVNDLAGSTRALSQAMCDPLAPEAASTSVASLERQVRELGACALKTYTGNGNWWLDDEAVAYPMLQEAERLGIRVVNVHKGLPGLLGPGSEEYVRTIDLPRVAADWKRMKFVAYHSGYFQNQKEPIGEFLQVVRSMKKRHRRRVYAELGSCFALAFMQGPEAAAHLVGSLLRDVGSKRILWGTDSIWWGSPQWQIDAFKTLEIPEPMRRQFGYPRLTPKRKARILGKNAAKLYGVKPKQKRCEISEDEIARVQREQGGLRKSRTHVVYGPRTRASFERLVAHGGGEGPARRGASHRIS